MEGNQNTFQTFVINRSELEGWLEPKFYSKENKLLVERLRSIDHFRLKEIVSFSSETWNQKDFFQETFPYIEISEIDLRTGLISDIKEIPVNNAPSRAKMIVRRNDIIISTTRPTRGAISYLQNINDIKIASTGFAVIRSFKKDFFIPEAFFYMLRMDFCLRQMGQRSSGGNYPAITQEELGNILIPKIKLDLQKEMIRIFNDSYQQRKNSEDKVKRLLSSIDTYLQDELGISQFKKTSSRKDRTFTVSFSEILGNRLDPEMILYSQTISESKFPTSSLGKLLTKSPQYGANEAGIEREDKNSPRYIRITDIDNFGFLKDELGKTAATIEEKYFLNDKDILFARSGNTVGKSYIFNKNEVDYECFFAGYMIRFVVDDTKILPDYLFGYSLSNTYKNWAKAIQRTAGQPNINAEEYKTLKIPLPPLEKQREIAEHIKSIRAEAIRILAEADKMLESAKKEVELMIFGE